MFRFLLAAALLAVAVGGCDSAGYSHNGRRSIGSAIPDVRTWRASGDLRNPQQAIDDNTGTFALSGDSYVNAQLTIDLGKPSMFNMIAVDQGSSRAGYPRRIAVLTSMDGKTYTLRHAAPGTPRYTVICLVSPTLARYVRLQVVTPGDKPWQVSEVYLY